MTTVHRLGHRAAQQVATGLVEAGLRGIYFDPYVLHGEEFYAKHVRNLHRGDSIDGLVTFTMQADAHDRDYDVTIMVNVTERGA